VAADWFAPVHRNAAEFAWLEVAARIAPASAVKLYGRSQKLYGFVMEFLDGDDVYLWKAELLAEAPEHGEAAAVGALVGQVHAASTNLDFDKQDFWNRDDFHSIRIEPYIVFTASKHKDIEHELKKLAEQLYQADQVLVHGDVSPKNILFRGKGPVILDAECATMGDASFDPSFCMNHLVLKAIHLPASRSRYLANALEVWKAYAPLISWEPARELEKRVCKLLPALMLGRVDGKSPVEYFSEPEKSVVRQIARQFIKSPVDRLETLISGIETTLMEMKA
ncbi:MAG: aminoglycoside phosphotransferase family protein, partial [Pseudomonadota bacterium]